MNVNACHKVKVAAITHPCALIAAPVCVYIFTCACVNMRVSACVCKHVYLQDVCVLHTLKRVEQDVPEAGAEQAPQPLTKVLQRPFPCLVLVCLDKVVQDCRHAWGSWQPHQLRECV